LSSSLAFFDDIDGNDEENDDDGDDGTMEELL
jgi:hypothetical protein